mgnify:CR=1 FL=1
MNWLKQSDGMFADSSVFDISFSIQFGTVDSDKCNLFEILNIYDDICIKKIFIS